MYVLSAKCLRHVQYYEMFSFKLKTELTLKVNSSLRSLILCLLFVNFINLSQTILSRFCSFLEHDLQVLVVCILHCLTNCWKYHDHFTFSPSYFILCILWAQSYCMLSFTTIDRLCPTKSTEKVICTVVNKLTVNIIVLLMLWL